MRSMPWDRVHKTMIRIPEANKPSLSGYVTPDRLLPWKWVDHRMSHARNYWVTTHSRGYPSSRPVWGIWTSPELLFNTGSRIGRHMQTNDKIQINLESGDELVIIEGRALPIEASQISMWVTAYKAKYNWDMPASREGVWQVLPQRVLAWISDNTGLDDGVSFSNSATEWKF